MRVGYCGTAATRHEKQEGGCQGDVMTDSWDSLPIQVVDNEIIVSLPGTSYSVIYYKPPDSPQLLGRNFPKHDELASR